MLKTVVKKGSYQDSVVLMLLTNELSSLDGVNKIQVMMATPANKDIFKESGLTTDELMDATANDMVVVADVNDLKRSAVLGTSRGIDGNKIAQLLIDNPFGNDSQMTPIVIIKNYASVSGKFSPFKYILIGVCFLASPIYLIISSAVCNIFLSLYFYFSFKDRCCWSCHKNMSFF